MEKRITIIFEVIIVIGILVYYTVTVGIPEFRKNFGSSDFLIDQNDYQNMFEVQVDDKAHFAVVVNQKSRIYHLFFFNKDAKCLYNQNLENQTIDGFLNQTVPILVQTQVLKNHSIVEVTRYGDTYYADFLNSLQAVFHQYHFTISIQEKKKTLQEKVQELGFNDSNEVLLKLDLYSKSILAASDEKKKPESSMNTIDISEYANTIYQKLNSYVQKQGISDMEIGNSPLAIALVPADVEGKIYPTENSWYYVKEGKVYAYIEFIIENKSSSFCYWGTIENRKEGLCE